MKPSFRERCWQWLRALWPLRPRWPRYRVTPRTNPATLRRALRRSIRDELRASGSHTPRVFPRHHPLSLMPEPDPLPAIKTPGAPPRRPPARSPSDVPPIPDPRSHAHPPHRQGQLRRGLARPECPRRLPRGEDHPPARFDDDRPFEREFAGMQRFEPVSRSHESQLNILQVGRGPALLLLRHGTGRRHGRRLCLRRDSSGGESEYNFPSSRSSHEQWGLV